MALLFFDGFDHYATADLSGKKWTPQAAGLTNEIQSGAGRRGTSAFAARAGSGLSAWSLLTRSFPASSQLFIGIAYKISALPSANALVCEFYDGSTRQGGLWIDTLGRLFLVGASGAALTNGLYATPLTLGEYVYIEVGMKFLDSALAGDVELRIDGVPVITNASGDTKGSSNASAEKIRIGCYAQNFAHTNTYDDLYLCNSSGGAPCNNFLGDSRADLLPPASDGTYSQFTPSTGTSHFALVDEATPNTTDYNESLTVGDRDSYGLANLAALTSQTVYGVQVNAAVLKDDAGAKSVATMVRSGATNADGASVALGAAQAYVSQVYELNPDGAVAWTESSVNAMEAGVKVSA